MAFSLFGCNKNEKVDNLTFQQYVAFGNYNKTKNQLSSGIDPNNIINDGVTPLMTASVNDQVEIIELLHKYKADLNAQSEKGWTAVLYASENGNLKSLKKLTELGANINLTLKGGEMQFFKLASGIIPNVQSF